MFLLVPAYPGSPGQKAVKRLCLCVCVSVCAKIYLQIGNALSSNGGFCVLQKSTNFKDNSPNFY